MATAERTLRESWGEPGDVATGLRAALARIEALTEAGARMTGASVKPDVIAADGVVRQTLVALDYVMGERRR